MSEDEVDRWIEAVVLEMATEAGPCPTARIWRRYCEGGEVQSRERLWGHVVACERCAETDLPMARVPRTITKEHSR